MLQQVRKLASKSKGRVSKYVKNRSATVYAAPMFWRLEKAVCAPNTFFSRQNLKTFRGHIQRMVYNDRFLRSRLFEARIQGIRAWEYGNLLGALKSCPPSTARSALDVGSGNSTFPVYLLKTGLASSMTTLDYADPLEVQTSEIQSAENLAGVRRVVGDMLDAPFAAKSFDLVTCISAIEHLDTDPETRERIPYENFLRRTKTALVALLDVVKDGGFLYLTTDVFIPGLQKTDGWRPQTGEDIWSAYRIGDIKDIFVDTVIANGFTFVGGYDYDPELLISSPDRSTFRGRYFTTFAMFVQRTPSR